MIWPDRFWQMLSVFGALIDSAPLDELEVETFEADAVLMLTFHQGKGLEFDHVYITGTGRDIDIAPALRTKLFSGEKIKFILDANNSPRTKDKQILALAEADRDREVYVALTRAKKSLTILHDISQEFPYMLLNPTLQNMFMKIQGTKNKSYPTLLMKEYPI